MDILILLILLIIFLYSTYRGEKDALWLCVSLFSGLLFAACLVVRFSEQISKCANSLFELAHYLMSV